ncbi:hypothetical protein ACHAPJ_012078 [Fusarium lateritium]
MHVSITGAGLGGLTLAQNLRKQGISYEVFERDESKDSRFQGWAIAMHTIVDDLVASMPDDLPDLKQAVDHIRPLNLPTQICLYPAETDNRVGWEDCTETPFIRAERYRLRNWLSTNINMNKRIMRIEHNDDGVTVFFHDNTSAKGDILVGADGAHSIARQQLLSKSNDEILRVITLAAIVGGLALFGNAFRRQLALSHGSSADDGQSAQYYWIMSNNDSTIADPDHWLRNASQQEKLDHIRNIMKDRAPRFREILELTEASGIRAETHV